MHARSHTVNQICMHTLTTLQKASNHLFFVLLGFFFFSCHKAPQTSQKDMKCTHNRDLVFIRITLHKQNQTTVNRWRGVCVWEGVKQYFQTFCLVLLMDQSEITTCQTISQSQTQKALRGRGGAVSKPFNAHFFVSGHFSDIQGLNEREQKKSAFLSNQRRTGATLKLRQIEL